MSLIVHKLAPQLYTPYNLDLPEETPTVEALEGTMLELRCVIGIIRHGDRTPKQKMKMEVRHPRLDKHSVYPFTSKISFNNSLNCMLHNFYLQLVSLENLVLDLLIIPQ